MFDKKNITILCKVVDNYGDIGVVYRLARSLSEIDKDLKIKIIIDNLFAFSSINKNINPELSIQYINNWKILNWNSREICKEEFLKNPPSIILECFQCGRPDWLEEILFAPNYNTPCQIINIDYLTAEPYAEDFHLLKSGTRSLYIKKINFMPGFTNKTGGLILDNTFINNLNANFNKRNKINEEFSILIFSYERDFYQLFIALNQFQQNKRLSNPNFSVKVYAANGKSQKYVLDAWEKTQKIVNLIKLPFLQQEEWDELLTKMNFLFIRGEDSLSRAVLCGVPFVWHAYIQDENYHLVKVNALLDLLTQKFSIEEKKYLTELWNDYNTPNKPLNENALKYILTNSTENNFINKFLTFSTELIENGNLGNNLLHYIEQLKL